MFWQILFWLLMVLWLIGGAFGGWWGPRTSVGPYANNGVLWLLIAILGGYAIGLPPMPG